MSPTKNLIQKIQTQISSPELLNYRLLSQKSSLDLYPKLLEHYLSIAENRFNKILAIPSKNRNFVNLIEAYLNKDLELDTLYSFIQEFNSTDANQKTHRIIEQFQAKHVIYLYKVTLNKEYYQILKNFQKSNPALSAAQKRSIFLLIRDMELSGVHLPEEKKTRLKNIDQKLLKLSLQFARHELDDRKRFSYHFNSLEKLQELPSQDQEMAKLEAKKRHKKGWSFTLSQPSYVAIMKYCCERNVRKHFFLSNIKIATQGTYDNRKLALEILKLRLNKAKLLGYANYADYIFKERMAENVDKVASILTNFAHKSRAKAKRDLQELTSFSGLKKIRYWDLAYYSEKLKKQKFQLSDKEIRNYFPLPQVKKGLFEIAQTLYDLKFKKIHPQTYHQEVETFEVYRKGQKVAYYLLDLFHRPQKKSGAWANILRGSHEQNNQTILPIVINVGNFGKSGSDKPPLLSHLETLTLFHEFGHALHAMLGQNRYRNLDSFHTEWDFIELPSQIMENWCFEPESLKLFGRHYQSNRPIPQKMSQALQKSRAFLSGLNTLRQNELGLLDLKLHTEVLPKTIKELDQKCLAIANRYSIIKKPTDYKIYGSFSHIFAGGYAAGYYSYLWSEILEADCFQKFKQQGILNPAIGRKFAQEILEKGALCPGLELFKNFMGREPNLKAILKKLQFLL